MSLIQKVKSIGTRASVVVPAVTTAVMTGATNVWATEGEVTAAGINIDFQPDQMFTYSNVIIDCLMPVVYITAGLSLGFTVIYALKSAFSSRM